MNRLRLAAGAAALALAMSAATATAQSAEPLAAKFGALESILNIALSPDGDKVIYMAPMAGGGRRLLVSDLAAGGETRAVIQARNKGETLQWCRFASDTRVVCEISTIVDNGGTLLGFSRLVTMNSDGSDVKFVDTGQTPRSLGLVQDGGVIIDWDVPGKPGHVLVTRDYVPEDGTGTRMSSSREGLGVVDLDLATLERRIVEQPRKGAVRYITDGKGTVRLMASRGQDSRGYDRSEITHFYRKASSRSWDTLGRITEDSSPEVDFWPVAVDSGKDVAYGFSERSGRQALFSLSLDGSAARQLLLSRPDVDVDELVRIGRDRRVVGAGYATERRMVEFFDPELKQLGTSLGRALPGGPTIEFVDASADESTLLLRASSDIDPGMFYLYDKATRQLEQLLRVRAELEGITMGPMRPITFAAADGTQIPAYLTLPPGSDGKNLPSIVMPHGGPGSRDEWGFDWLVQFFAVRGFAVIQPNFRGSAGYGSDWYQDNGFRSWRTAIGDVNDAGRHLLSEGIAAPDKLAIVGWSYGGYAALQSSVLDPALFKAIVAIAPVTDLERFRQEAADFTNYRQVDAFIGQGPHVREGSPAQNAASIRAPVLLFHGDTDQNVGVAQSRLMRDKLRDAGKQVTFVEFPGLDHYLTSAEARTRLLSESDAFLRRSLDLPAN